MFRSKLWRGLVLGTVSLLLVACGATSSAGSVTINGTTPNPSATVEADATSVPGATPEVVAAPPPPADQDTSSSTGLSAAEADPCNQPFPEGQRPPANCRYPKASRNLPEPVAIATDGPMDRCQVSVNRWIAVGQGSCLKSFMTSGVQISVFQGNGNANCTFFVRAYRGNRQLPTSGKLGCVSASDVRYDQGLVFLVGLNGEEVTLP